MLFKNMDKCRICLLNRRCLYSIFDLEKGISFADMISSLGNVKIEKGSGVTEAICRLCCKKLIEAYDFKILIQRSDITLWESTNLKKINFDNINDIKIKVEIDMKPVIPKHEDWNEYFKDGASEICYSNTVIKKVDILGNQCKKPIPVLEFLKTIKDEPVSDYDYYNDIDQYGANSDDDDDYSPPYSITKKKKVKRKYYKRKLTKKKNSENNPKNKFNRICIKPVLLRDYKLIYSKIEKSNEPKQKRVFQAKEEICPYCGRMSKSLKNHLLQHTGERSFKCDQCSKGFFKKIDLIKHMKKHSEAKEFKCNQCVAAFNMKDSLRSHMLSHSEEKKFVCDICSKGFKRCGALSRHKKMHNSANKNVMCELCNMSFFTNAGLKHHMRVHTGERPYNCEICHQPYSYKHDFNRHCFKKHGVFFKRRSVYVMNEEVLKQEKILMRDLMLRVRGIVNDGKPLNPFDGPQGVLAFEQAVKALESRKISIDFQL